MEIAEEGSGGELCRTYLFFHSCYVVVKGEILSFCVCLFSFLVIIPRNNESGWLLIPIFNGIGNISIWAQISSCFLTILGCIKLCRANWIKKCLSYYAQHWCSLSSSTVHNLGLHSVRRMSEH